MQTPCISAIAAIGQNRELGKANELLWRIPEDLARVKALTTGHPIIIGRKTYESIGRPLPNRQNIVISRDRAYQAPGCQVVDSLEAALDAARVIEQDEIFIFGGATIYEQALPQTDKLYLTQIDASEPSADVFFPSYTDQFSLVESESHLSSTGVSFTWQTLARTGT